MPLIRMSPSLEVRSTSPPLVGEMPETSILPLLVPSASTAIGPVVLTAMSPPLPERPPPGLMSRVCALIVMEPVGGLRLRLPPLATTRFQLIPWNPVASSLKSSVEPSLTAMLPVMVQVLVADSQSQRRPLGAPSRAQIWATVVGGRVLVVVLVVVVTVVVVAAAAHAAQQRATARASRMPLAQQPPCLGRPRRLVRWGSQRCRAGRT